MESSPPRMAAGNARSAAAEVVGDTPGAGKAAEEHPGQHRQHGGDDPHDRRHPARAARPSARRCGGPRRSPAWRSPQSENFDQAKKPPSTTSATSSAATRVWGTVMPSDVDRGALPRVADRHDVDAEAPGDLGLQHDVDADGHDGDGDDRPPHDRAHEQPLDHQRRRPRRRRCRAARPPGTASRRRCGTGRRSRCRPSAARRGRS